MTLSLLLNLYQRILVTLITLVAALIGFGWSAATTLTTIKMTQMMDEQRIQGNSEATKAHEQAIREGQENQQKFMMIMATMHGRGR
jgi:hypothetical protein